ncbi:hypothetical protein D3C81_2224750 [compost metagenome]
MAKAVRIQTHLTPASGSLASTHSRKDSGLILIANGVTETGPPENAPQDYDAAAVSRKLSTSS